MELLELDFADDDDGDGDTLLDFVLLELGVDLLE